eukprot:s158_g9.t3
MNRPTVLSRVAKKVMTGRCERGNVMTMMVTGNDDIGDADWDAPVPRANLQDRPVAAERREALERREREAAERAAQAARPAPRPAPPPAPEPRLEPRSEKVPSDHEDQADKDKVAKFHGKTQFLPATAMWPSVAFQKRLPQLGRCLSCRPNHIWQAAAGHAGWQKLGPPGSRLARRDFSFWSLQDMAGSWRSCRGLGQDLSLRLPATTTAPMQKLLPQRRSLSNKIRIRFKMSKHRYLKNVKRVRYISAIPQFTGPLGRQTKKRCIMKDYRKTPRLRVFKRER